MVAMLVALAAPAMAKDNAASGGGSGDPRGAHARVVVVGGYAGLLAGVIAGGESEDKS